MGTIFRIADWFGIKKLICSLDSADVYNPKTVRSAMGAGFSLPLLFPASAEEALQALRSAGLRLMLADVQGRPYDEVSLQEPLALVLGAEADGASPFWREICEEILEIPMPGGAESLNVAAAAGILLYEVLRQRKL